MRRQLSREPVEIHPTRRFIARHLAQLVEGPLIGGEIIFYGLEPMPEWM
jgi:hypothetical protein